MRRTIFTTGLFLFAAATFTALEAQVLVVSQNKCEFAKMGELRAFNDSASTAILQELVNEGALFSAGAAYHLWGDEWNVVYYYVAQDVPAFLIAYREFVRRFVERYPSGMEMFQSACFEHKDSFYSMGEVTGPPEP